MKYRTLFRLVFCALGLALFSRFSFAMDDHAIDQIVIMANNVDNLAPMIKKYADELRQTVQRIDRNSRQVSANCHRLEREAFESLDDMQNGILKFRACFDQNRVADCTNIYQTLLQNRDRLFAIKLTLCDQLDHRPEPNHANRAKNYSADAIRGRALESSRIARQAHLSGPIVLSHERFSMIFDPHHLAPNGLDGIPQSLRQLPGVHIYYFPSPDLPRKASGTCGTLAIGNALAIRDAVLSDSLNPVTIFRNAATHNDLNSNEGTRTEEAVELAIVLHLSDFHCLMFGERYPKGGRAKDNPFSIIESTNYNHPQLIHTVNLTEEDQFQATIFEKIRNSETVCVNFLTCVDRAQMNDHGVLISIIKQKGRTPIIIYMDCNNEPIRDNSKDAAFIHYLYLQCIA